MAVTTAAPQPAAAPKRFAQKPAPKKSNTMLIAAIAAGVVALGLGVMAFMMMGKAKAAGAKNATHVDNLSNLAAVFDLGGKATWTNAADIDTAWKAITDAATTRKGDLATAQEQLTASQARIGEMQTQLTAAETGAAEAQKLKAQIAQSAQATAQAATLGTALSNKISQLEAELNTAKSELTKAEEQIAAFSAASASTAAAATEAAKEPASAAPAEAAADANPAPAAEAAPAASADNITFKPEKSEVFKKSIYNEAAQSLRVTLLNDKTIEYQGISKELFNGLQNAGLSDVYFRMKIMGLYPSNPPDVETIVKMTTGE